MATNSCTAGAGRLARQKEGQVEQGMGEVEEVEVEWGDEGWVEGRVSWQRGGGI